MASFPVILAHGRYPDWCSDSQVAQRLLASDRCDLLAFSTSNPKVRLRTDVYQRTNSPNQTKKFPESFESLESSRC
jgi:hypothetical protein